MIGGLVLGSLQLPLVFLLGKALGASTSFSVIASNTVLFTYDKSSYANKHKDRSAEGLFPLILVMGMVGGAAISAAAAGSWFFPTETPLGLVKNFIGGMIMIFGARLASGCTSGHGITGVGYQAIHSLLGVGCMFVGAMGSSALIELM